MKEYIKKYHINKNINELFDILLNNIKNEKYEYIIDNNLIPNNILSLFLNNNKKIILKIKNKIKIKNNNIIYIKNRIKIKNNNLTNFFINILKFVKLYSYITLTKVNEKNTLLNIHITVDIFITKYYKDILETLTLDISKNIFDKCFSKISL